MQRDDRARLTLNLGTVRFCAGSDSLLTAFVRQAGDYLQRPPEEHIP
jgi:hypothetical protein